MKKTILPLFLLIITLISSCSDDEPTNNTATSGDWNLSELSYTGSATGYSYVGEAITITNAVISLNDDNTYTSSGAYVIELTTTVNGQSSVSTIPVDFNTLFNAGTWERNGNTITFTSGGQTSLYTISNETSTHMEWGGAQTVSTGGVSSTVDFHIELDK